MPQTKSPVPHTGVLTSVQTPPLHVDPIGQHLVLAPEPQSWLAELQGTQTPVVESLQANPDGQHAALTPVPHTFPLQEEGMQVLPAPHTDPVGQHLTVPLAGHLTSLVPHVTVCAEQTPFVLSVHVVPGGQHLVPQDAFEGMHAVHIPFVESLQTGAFFGQHTEPQGVPAQPMLVGAMHVSPVPHVYPLGQHFAPQRMSPLAHVVATGLQTPVVWLVHDVPGGQHVVPHGSPLHCSAHFPVNGLTHVEYCGQHEVPQNLPLGQYDADILAVHDK